MTNNATSPCEAPLSASQCPFGMVYEIQINNLAEDIRDLKARVDRLEAILTRGVVLLVANLVAVIISLGQQLLHA
ncbi:MAG: hypothetical protein KJ060_17940 [Candidatus Hydrogenedentes bacterium]|nr:hypothetical protein [Candidatus Hydrogenedentota bacterium]